jgi:hypothetical protein
MIWKIVSFGLVLWFVQSMFHLTGAMTLLLGIVALTALVSREILASHRMQRASRKSKQWAGADGAL